MKIEDTKQRFFSVKHALIIEGVRFIPAVCYPLTGNLQNVILEAEAKGLAKTYTEKMRFVSGVAYPVKKNVPGVAAVSSASQPVNNETESGNENAGKKSGKNSGRDFE